MLLRASLLIVCLAACAAAAAVPAVEPSSKEKQPSGDAQQKMGPNDAPSVDPLCATAAEVTLAAQWVRGCAPVGEALIAVRVQPGEAADAAGRALAALGLETALDLHILNGSGPEAQELMRDTIAIMLTVLVGAAGYAMQDYIA